MKQSLLSTICSPEQLRSAIAMTVFALCISLWPSIAPSQSTSCGTWTSFPSPRGRANFGMSYDSGRDVVVMYGGYAQWGGGVNAGDTWEWSGDKWSKKASSNAGPGDRDHTMLGYDPIAKKTVMFGGWGNTPELFNSDTWLWDGTSWSKAAPQHAPQPRIASSMVYFAGDPQVRGVYVFGGDVLHEAGNPNSRYSDNDLWKWNGTDWQQVSPLNTPPSARWGHRMASYSKNGTNVIAVFGGFGATALDELWFYDPATSLWEQQSKLGAWPDPRAHVSMTYDSTISKLVMHGGWNYYYYDDTWVFDIANGWTQLNTSGPTSRAAHSSVTTPAGVILFGGVTNGQVFDDTWKFTASTWTKTFRPRIDAYGEAIYDPIADTALLLGMSSSTNGAIETWRGHADKLSLEPQVGPESRYYHHAAYDSARGKTVLFGGHSNPQSGSGAAIADTWEYDGAAWEQKAPAHTPPARWSGAMTYDASRRVVVLYGGFDSNQTPLGDTWEWNGLDWQQRMPTHSPGTLIWHAMAYDGAHSRVLLHGGKPDQTASVNINTWAWDGTDWTIINSDIPAARYAHELVYDSTRQLIIAFGGYGLSMQNNAIGEFNGTTWSQVSQQPGQTWPAFRAFFPMVYDANRKAVAVLGSDSGGGETTLTYWEYATADSDGDGTPDCADLCPNDPFKVVLGSCGCGASDADNDGDGTPNCTDVCPHDASKIIPGVCGCGVSDADTDLDGIPACIDLCPADSHKTAPGACGCGVQDLDSDSDGALDCNDSCAFDPFKTSSGICGCGIADGDTDADGVANCLDSCPADQLKTAPGICGCNTADSDLNGNGRSDCLDPNMSALNPRKLSIKQKGNVVIVTALRQAGMEYLYQYAPATKVGKKWREGRAKLVRSKLSSLTIKNLKRRQYYHFSVKYVLANTKSAFSRNSPLVRYQVK